MQREGGGALAVFNQHDLTVTVFVQVELFIFQLEAERVGRLVEQKRPLDYFAVYLYASRGGEIVPGYGDLLFHVGGACDDGNLLWRRRGDDSRDVIKDQREILIEIVFVARHAIARDVCRANCNLKIAVEAFGYRACRNKNGLRIIQAIRIAAFD